MRVLDYVYTENVPSSFLVASVKAAILLLSVTLSGPVHATDESSSWNFVVLPDLHIAEAYLHKNRKEGLLASHEEREALIAEHAKTLSTVGAELGTELLLLPGDLANGEWHSREFARYFLPDASPGERVLSAANIVYGSFNRVLADAGFDNVLLVTGDHEIADDPWFRYSDKDWLIPTFREAVNEHFTKRTEEEYKEEGYFSRPVGTRFANTSFALKHRNALFVVVDVFEGRTSDLERWLSAHLPGRLQRVLSGNFSNTLEETVTGSVSGDHLVWLEAVLREAASDPSVEYIFVSGHLPVLHPVRARYSSAMLLDNDADSDFWKLLRRYGVDIYFAGEVHADTVIEDTESDLIQVASHSNGIRMALEVRLIKGGYRIVQYRVTSEGRLAEAGVYERNSRGEVTAASGVLRPIDLSAPPLQYEFIGPRESEFRNLGTFGSSYNLVCETCGLQDVSAGGVFSLGEGRVASLSDGYLSPVFNQGRPTTISVSFAGDVASNGVIFAARNPWDAGVTVGFDDNRIVVEQDGSIALTDSLDVPQGRGRHTLVLRHRMGGLLSELDVFLDGRLVPIKVVEGDDLRLMLKSVHRFTIGGLLDTDTSPFREFSGRISSFTAWARPLSDEEIFEFFPTVASE